MATLWLTNLPADVTDDEISGWLEKYGFPACDEITRVPGDGSRPSAMIAFADVNEDVLRRLQPRIHGVYVRGKTISAQVAPPARPEPR